MGAGASEDEVSMMRTYGRRIGLAFQIMDDILDAVGDEKKVGKKLRKDFNKASAVRILGLDGARRKMDELIDGAIRVVENALGGRGGFLKAMANFIRERTY